MSRHVAIETVGIETGGYAPDVFGAPPPVSAGPIRIVDRRVLESGVVEAWAREAADGGRIVLAIGPRVTEEMIAALAPLAALQAGSVIEASDADDPLLADRTCTAVTDDGHRLHLFAARPVFGEGVVLARTAAGDPVARQISLGAGTVIAVGCRSLFEERWLTHPANCAFVARVLGRPADPVAGAETAAGRWPTAHGAPPVVTATDTGWARPRSPGHPDDLEALAREAGHATRELPAEIHEALIDFADAPPSAGALLLRNMPIGDVPPTPRSPAAATTKDLTSELTLLTVARMLGQPVGYEPELGGRLVQNICPTAFAQDRQTSTSSRVELMFHTEAAFHPYRPRYLLLLCLRSDPERQALTTLASIRELLPALGLRTRRVLFEPRFRTAADESYVGGRPTQLSRPAPILSGAWDRPHLVFDADLMVGVDREAEDAISELAALTAGMHTAVALEPGDLLVVDNTVAVHGRTPFRAHYDGRDRWLQRTFVVADLGPSSGDRDGRIITTHFAR